MPERIKSNDVLDANARIKRSFTALIAGFFKNTGPNPWDDYEFIRAEQGTLDVYPGTTIQIEEYGTRVRMRKDGRVIRVIWKPGDTDPVTLRDASAGELRRYFIETYLEDYTDAPGLGAAAVIARKLT